MKKSVFCAIGLSATVSVFADTIVPPNQDICNKSDKLATAGFCYQISSCGDLYKFAEMVEGDQSICGQLTTDIIINMDVLNQYGAVNNVSALNTPLAWVPMGTAENPFRGVFLGDGHSIKGLYIKDESSLANLGLFGVIADARIDSLNILDSYFTSKKQNANIGSVVGSQVGGRINKVHTGAHVKGVLGGTTGGIVGKMTAGGISTSYNTGRVESDGDFTGGLVGRAESENFNDNNVIENSFNSGRVTGKYDVGGLVGALYNYNVINCYNHGSVKGTGEMGGLIGVSEGSVKSCYNTGRVEASSSNSSVNCAIGTFRGVASNIYNNSDICDIYNAFAPVSAKNITTAAFIQDGLPKGFDDTYWSAGYGDKGGDIAEFYINIRLPQISDINGAVQPVDTVKIKFKDDILFKEEVSLSDVEKTEFVFNEGSYGFNDFELTKAAWGEDGSISGKFMGIEFTQDNVSIVFNGENSATIYGYSKNCTNADRDMSTGGNAVLKRSLVAKGYSTIMLPFSADIPSDSKASFYKFVNVAMVNGKWNVQVDKKPVTKIEANTPYFVTVSEDVNSIEFSNVSYVTVNCGTYSMQSNGWELVGTYEFKEWESDDPELGTTYGFAGINDNGSAEAGKFGKIEAGAYIYPMRVYLKKIASKKNAAPLPENIDVVFVDPEAGKLISKIIGTYNTRTGEFHAADHYYDTKGRHLGSKKPKAKGNYYNKKVIVK